MACNRRCLLLGLDGFDLALAKRFADEGLLPNFARLRRTGASVDLDHGRDKYSGLAWEHLSTGVSPSHGGRWSAVTFHPKSYQATQDHTSVRPMLADLSDIRSVVFDFPYFHLGLARNVRGLTSWGAHDPGVASAARPDGLHEEIEERFGPYPAPEWIYGFCWPSAKKARAAGEALARATRMRSKVARWLLQERLPDWHLGVVVISECHSGIEPLWHGVDQHHPLHGLGSAQAAETGLKSVYAAIDDLIGDFVEEFSDSVFLLVAMHGMGPNDGDVPSMALLPELLYRQAFGVPYMRPVEFESLPDGTPLLPEDKHWGEALWKAVPAPRLKFHQRLAKRAKRMFSTEPADGADLEWMPAARYAPFWPKMPAFALPSFYDGRVRINVQGREAKGKVRAREYAEVCRQIQEVVVECRNLLNGRQVVAESYSPKRDPYEVGPTEADVYIVWKSAPLGLRHPRLGDIGPLPYLRTGGHTGEYGFLTVVGSKIPAGHYGVASSFDVVPTMTELLGQTPLPGCSGKSLVAEMMEASGHLAPVPGGR